MRGHHTIDLVPRAGVLVKVGDGQWGLVPDYSERQIYLVGDGKTVENLVKFM